MICSYCKKELQNGANFCDECGAAVEAVPPAQEGATATNGIQPGFSGRIDDPALNAILKKNRKGALIFAVILILLPLAVAFFIGFSKDDFSSLPIGLAVSAVFLVFNLFSLARKKAQNQWDGVVIDKQSRERLKRDPDDSDSGRKAYTEYTVTLRDDRGKKRKITEGTPHNSAHPYFEYLSVGDRVRYHPQFGNFYEKFDKSHDTYLYCAICGKKNDIADAHCAFCDAPLVK